ncbi:hypothetical protein HK100_004557 [Physocladia obscura]|uniref:Uncharacterized protein n=1 Tax=Physocladia obscura TaxID=109957 RepID=A0AAD5XDT0_9FUNG|nr:hypothetical protein HK100_004557 [Physocladia obscura]
MLFFPAPNERSLKSKAILTFVASANPEDYLLHPFKDADWFFIGAALHAYAFLHNEKVKLGDEDDIEFVVMTTNLMTQPFIELFLTLGARVIIAPSIEIPGREKPGDKYQYLYTKLNLYRLENVYTAIMFLDVDINFFHYSPATLFSYVISRNDTTVSPPAPYFFASTREWQGGNGIFNTGIQLVIPSVHHVSAMLSLARDPAATRYGDQGLLNFYFSDSGPRQWVELPQFWNMNHLEARNASEVQMARGVHGKFWSECRYLNKDTAVLFQDWRNAMNGIRKVQLDLLVSKDGKKISRSPAIPAIPLTCGEWHEAFGETTRKWHTAFAKIALVSFGESQEHVLKSRDMFSQYAGGQLVHIKHEPDKYPTLFSQLMYINLFLLERFDFVWILAKGVSMVPPSKLFWLDFRLMRKRAGLGDAVFAFRDCLQNNLSGSLIVSKQTKPKIDKLIESAQRNNWKTDDDFLMTERLFEKISGNGGKNALQIEAKSSFYEFEEKYCHGFFATHPFGNFNPGKPNILPSINMKYHPEENLFDNKYEIPSVSAFPAKSLAIVVALEYTSENVKFQTDFSAVCMQAYIVLRHIKNSTLTNVEFLVMIDENVPKRYVTAIILLGARILTVPSLNFENRRYTNLQIHQLEAVYSIVASITSDISFFDDSFVGILSDFAQQHWTSREKNFEISPYIFAAATDFQNNEKFMGIHIFTPSIKMYNRLVEYAKDRDYARDGYLSLVEKYFDGRLKMLPQNLKFTAHPRNASEITNLSIILHKWFWNDCDLLEDGMFQKWEERMSKIRKIQMNTSEKSAVTATVPSVSRNCTDWKILVSQSARSGIPLDDTL